MEDLQAPKKYVCKKEVMATPMTRQEYNTYRGWQLPADEHGSDEGYLVEYLDGGTSNHDNHKGYISWSPKEVFDNGYTDISTAKVRLCVERNELSVRFEALKTLLLNEVRPAFISPAQWNMMIEQHAHMRRYLAVLENRIEYFDAV